MAAMMRRCTRYGIATVLGLCGGVRVLRRLMAPVAPVAPTDPARRRDAIAVRCARRLRQRHPAVPQPPPRPTGSVFADPDGRYTIEVGDDWNELPAAQQIEAWAVAAPADGFTANVNVLDEQAAGVDLDQYVELSITTIEQLDSLDLLDQRRVTGSSGDDLAIIEYAGTAPGADRELHFLAVVGVGSDGPVVATLTTQPADFDAVRARVEPFMLTLRTT